MARPIDTTQTPEERLAHIRAANANTARKWRQKNPLKAARNTLRYWQKKVAELEKQEAAKADEQIPGD